MLDEGIHCDVQELLALEHRASALLRRNRRRSREVVAGAVRAPFRGRGMDYAESRPYSVGDDVRHIDWRVTARTGTLHSKLFHPERDRISAVVAHCAERLRFGTRGCFKSVQQARVAALFLWAAQKQGDRCMVSCFGERAEEVPPQHARKGVVRLLNRLERWQRPPSQLGGAHPSSANGLHRALRDLSRHVRSGAHVLVLADESAIDEQALVAIAACQKHNDMLVGLLVDPIEYSHLPAGSYPVWLGSRPLSTRLGEGRVSEAWREHFRARWAKVTTSLHAHGIRSALVSTADDPVDALRGVLADRGATP